MLHDVIYFLIFLKQFLGRMCYDAVHALSVIKDWMKKKMKRN